MRNFSCEHLNFKTPNFKKSSHSKRAGLVWLDSLPDHSSYETLQINIVHRETQFYLSARKTEHISEHIYHLDSNAEPSWLTSASQRKLLLKMINSFENRVTVNKLLRYHFRYLNVGTAVWIQIQSKAKFSVGGKSNSAVQPLALVRDQRDCVVSWHPGYPGWMPREPTTRTWTVNGSYHKSGVNSESCFWLWSFW